MKSLYSIVQVFNMNSTVACSIWNGYGKKRTPIYAGFIRTELPLRVDKIFFTGRCR